MALCDLSITEMDYLLAETEQQFCLPPLKGPSVSLLPQVHLELFALTCCVRICTKSLQKLKTVTTLSLLLVLAEQQILN